jgi:hypothetical protein
MANQEKNCYLGVNGKKHGPLSEQEIKNLYAQKKITGDTKFIRQGMSDWIPLSRSGIINISAADDGLPPLQSQSLQQPYPQLTYGYQNNPRLLIKTVTDRLAVAGVFWIVIAVLLAMGSIPFALNANGINSGYGFSLDVILWGLGAVAFLIFAILTYAIGSSALKFKKSILRSPIGIIGRFEPIGGKVFLLVYGAVFGLLGLIPAIIYFSTRSFVMKNYMLFEQIENQHKKTVTGAR